MNKIKNKLTPKEIVSTYNKDLGYINLKLANDKPIELGDTVLRKRNNKKSEWIITVINSTYLQLVKEYPEDYIRVEVDTSNAQMIIMDMGIITGQSNNGGHSADFIVEKDSPFIPYSEFLMKRS